MADNRHLAAIFFSDMAGYTAASNKNQDRALELLEEHRAILRPLIRKFEGREIKTMGDGFLVEFGTARAATLCAIEAQQAHHTRNLSVPPERKVEIRIGIHISDVVEAGNDVYGDGVNIAARLMNVARPGRICISSPVMDQVRSAIDRWVVKIGPQKLKGISRNITAFIIYPEFSADQPPPFRAKMKVKVKKHKRLIASAACLLLLAGAGLIWGKPAFQAMFGEKSPRIVVLPLKPLGLGAEDLYLAEGITDEIISSLSRLDVIRVLSKTTAAKLGAGDAGEMARELNLSGIVEGSIQKVGESFRVHVGMTDTKSDENLWSKDFEGTISETFETQKNIAQEIARQFLQHARVKGGEEKVQVIAARARPKDAAYLRYLKAIQLMNKRSEFGLKESLRELEEAINIDGNFSYALAAAANVYGLQNFYGHIQPEVATERGLALASRALELDANNAEALLWFAEYHSYIRFEWSKAIEFYERAIQANPSMAKIYQWYGEALVSLGRMQDARVNFTKARELDPLSPIAVVASAEPDYFTGKYDAAMAVYRRAAEIDPESMLPHLWQGRVLLAKKDYAKALESFQRAESFSERSTMIEALKIDALFLLGRKAEAQEMLKGLLARRNYEHVSHYSLAHVLLTLGHEDQALGELEAAFKAKESLLGFLKVDPGFAPLHNHERFKLLLRQMAL